jgi:hypothetical protein
MAKKTTLSELAQLIEKGLTAVAGDIADLKIELKGDIARVQEQVTSIEAQLKHGRYETRLGNREDKVFGSTTSRLS